MRYGCVLNQRRDAERMKGWGKFGLGQHDMAVSCETTVSHQETAVWPLGRPFGPSILWSHEFWPALTWSTPLLPTYCLFVNWFLCISRAHATIFLYQASLSHKSHLSHISHISQINQKGKKAIHVINLQCKFNFTLWDIINSNSYGERIWIFSINSLNLDK